MKLKILFIAVHRPFRSPSQRFRFDQFMEFFEQNDCQITYSSLINESEDQWFYNRGFTLRKIWLILKSLGKRLNDIRIASRYDLVFVQREAIMIGSSFFERQLAKRTALVYDFDDSIWLLDMSEANKRFGWMKRPQKTSEIIAAAKLVFAGNDFLANYARSFNSKVVVVPTVLKTDHHGFSYSAKEPNPKIIIGWIGSTTTIKHIEWGVEFLTELLRRYSDTVELVIVSDKQPMLPGINHTYRKWSPQVEQELLTTMDIGIMPLPDDEWTRGKCGFKGLQCMSYGIPVVMSAVGVNNQIIEHGVNGFLAKNTEEWIEALSLLLQNQQLRIDIGAQGKKTVMDSYAAENWQQRILELLRTVKG
jgi:glycosyltransferase involved in cell wall biosynthesis